MILVLRPEWLWMICLYPLRSSGLREPGQTTTESLPPRPHPFQDSETVNDHAQPLKSNDQDSDDGQYCLSAPFDILLPKDQPFHEECSIKKRVGPYNVLFPTTVQPYDSRCALNRADDLNVYMNKNTEGHLNAFLGVCDQLAAMVPTGWVPPNNSFWSHSSQYSAIALHRALTDAEQPLVARQRDHCRLFITSLVRGDGLEALMGKEYVDWLEVLANLKAARNNHVMLMAIKLDATGSFLSYDRLAKIGHYEKTGIRGHRQYIENPFLALVNLEYVNDDGETILHAMLKKPNTISLLKLRVMSNRLSLAECVSHSQRGYAAKDKRLSSALKQADAEGNLPLHLAMGPYNHFDLLGIFNDLYPEAWFQRNSAGLNPGRLIAVPEDVQSTPIPAHRNLQWLKVLYAHATLDVPYVAMNEELHHLATGEDPSLSLLPTLDMLDWYSMILRRYNLPIKLSIGVGSNNNARTQYLMHSFSTMSLLSDSAVFDFGPHQ
eukprot:Clim_evm3s93 gene=Clim_evmTU3s93